jgi:hypothetical protein
MAIRIEYIYERFVLSGLLEKTPHLASQKLLARTASPQENSFYLHLNAVAVRSVSVRAVHELPAYDRGYHFPRELPAIEGRIVRERQ